VLDDLKAHGLLGEIKDHIYSIGKCDRCKTIVEPRISTQWFVKIEPLARRAIEVVENGEIRFTPENYAKTYFEWMRNIHDWCISRQLWWGHRIPAWHCAQCQGITVSRETPKKCVQCGSSGVEQDPDVLDTWFSSALLPFTTLGWPIPPRCSSRGSTSCSSGWRG
jgi:valyl-tRNA synthetase